MDGERNKKGDVMGVSKRRQGLGCGTVSYKDGESG